jgi:hypothetical protein
MTKFSSKMRADILEELRKHASESGRTLASILEDAVQEYLMRQRVRPAFQAAAERVMDKHAELLARLAR